MINFLTNNWVALVTFLAGIAIGWAVNHWYAIYLKLPKLTINGSGSGSNFYGSGYSYTSVSIGNQLRQLGFRLPTTIILGKRLPTQFGKLVIARDVSNHTTANLLDSSGAYICQLFWLINEKATSEANISSGQSASLIIFMRKEDDAKEYVVYQPISNADLTPRTSKIPSFNSSMDFFVEISYLYGSKNLKFPVKAKIGYDGNLICEYGNGK